ncbi:MAG TPA: hypothetical protein ENI57_03065, partial [Ignavibacteria bacterium]|nr:hypothetical protein [Ignavibacteria bacterium]
EIMYSPLSGQTEWVELYNMTDSPINVSGWSFADNNTTVTFTNNNINIPSKSFIVLSKDSTVLTNYSIPVQLVVFSNMPSLNNSSDAVVLHDSLGLLIDSLSYFSSWGGDNGKSLERIEPNVSSVMQSNWGTSKNLLGATPGGINSLTQKDFNIGISEVIFDPAKPFVGDNVDISAIVNNTGKNTVQYSLQLFEDTNSDLLPDVLLETKSNLKINSSETKTVFFNFQITNLQNKTNFIINAVFADDQDTTDNSKYVSIEPGYPQSTIVINEIMYTPVGGEPEWVEIYNTSPDSISLFQWTITDQFATPVSVTITENVFIPSKSYLLITRNSNVVNYHKAIPSKIVVLNLPGLNNNTDGVVLRDNRGLTIDSVLYNKGWGGTSGYSLERKDSSVASNLSGNWSSSKDNEMSTPGRINSVSNRKFDLTASEITFNPKYPVAGNNVTPSLKVINKGQSNANNFSVRFFIDTNSNNVPEKLLSTESGLSLNAFDSVFINSSVNIEDLQNKVLVGANIVFNQDEDTLNNYSEAFTQPGFARNSMLINEIMYAPKTGKTEWIELINNSGESLNLKDWSISDLLPSPTKNFITTTDLLLNPGEYLILTKNLSFFNQYPNINSQVKIVNFGSLGNTKDGIILYDFRGAIIDSIFYSSNWGGGNGFSLERIDVDDSSTTKSNWGTSINNNGATPGAKNSLTPFANDLSITSFTHSPQLIIEGNNVNLSATIKNIGKNTTASFLINLFNDSNFDNVGSANEIIFSKNYSNLSKSDSITISTTINSPSAGNYNIIAEVDFTADEDTSNNKKIDNFTVVNEPNTFNNIVINEIMYVPPLNQSEWIELYNKSDSSININNWVVSDNSTSIIVTDNNFILAPKSFVVLGSDSTLLNTYGHQVNFLFIPNLPSLNNSGDAVTIHDSLGLLIDSLSYLSTWGGDNGKSLERINPNDSSILQSNWGTSVNPWNGTPGDINSLTKKDFNIGVTDIIFNPGKPFAGDNVQISAIVNNTGKNTVQYSLQLFEMTGADILPGYLSETKTNLTINPGENKTESFNHQIVNLQSARIFIVKAVLVNDQDLTDNTKQKIIMPGYRRSTIVINEIMYTPIDGEPEWIELYNTSADSINLVQWSLTDRFATPVSVFINTNVFIPPKSYLIVARDSSILNFHKVVPSKLVILNLPGLNNTTDGVVLKDNRNLIIDSVVYNNSWGGTNGYSLERKSFSVASNLSGNWSSSKDNEMSTPGRINSISNRKFDLTASEITFNPQYPVAGDNVNPSLKVINKGQSNAYNFSVRFFIDTNSDNIPDQLLSTETGLNLSGFDSAYVSSSIDIENLQHKVLVGAEIIFSQDEDTLNNYSEAFTQPGFAHNSMLINEIMYAPETGNTEWIELINNSNESLNLKNWSISDILPSPTKNFIATTNLLLNPDEFLILTKDSSFFNRYPDIKSQVKIVNFGSLGNTKDGIIVYDFRGAIIDSIFYSSNWGGGNGFSLERISTDNPTNDSTNWTTSLSVNHSTPGKTNSINNIVQGTKGELVINEIMYDPGENNTEFIEFY